MKRQIFVLLMALVLATGTVLMAQSTGNTTQVPLDQQTDQSGQPETGTGPDVDVDTGANAEDGVVDVDVDATTDPDTAAQGNDPDVRTGTYTDTAMDDDNLPDTAGEMPLLALIGLVSLAGAVIIRVVR